MSVHDVLKGKNRGAKRGGGGRKEGREVNTPSTITPDVVTIF